MLNQVSVPKKREGFWLWFVKILTGILVIALLFVHLIVNHLTAPEGLLTFDEVVAYLSNPWVAFMELSFLVIVVVHALAGTRSIVLDLNPSDGTMRIVDILFVLIGLVSIGYGFWLTSVIIGYA